MVKCPKCGSTAQVKELGSNDNNKIFTQRYKCGCGCQFNREYHWRGDIIYLVGIKIINESGDE